MSKWNDIEARNLRKLLKKVYMHLICAILKLYHSIWKSSYSIKLGKNAFVIFPSVFDPKFSMSSTLLASTIHVEPNESLLDMGTGSGVLAIIAAKQAKDVIAIDINTQAIQCAYMNASLQRVKNISFIVSDLFAAVKKDKMFDLILFNPPYFEKSAKNMMERAWCNSNIVPFLRQSKHFLKPKGRIIITFSSMGDLELLYEACNRLGFSIKHKREKSLFFERIFVFELKKRI